MKPCTFEDSLAVAETACANHIFKTTGMTVCVAVNDQGRTDCCVFDIGYLQTGEHATYQAKAYHFRAKLDIYRRNRQDVQKAIMRILATFPINADVNEMDELRESSNVIVFRLSPQTQGVSEITTTDVQQVKDARAIRCFTATVLFDVVFRARFD